MNAVYREVGQIDEEQLARLREVLIRKFANANMKPDRHATYLRLLAIKHNWQVEAILADLKTFSLQDIQARAPALLPVTCSRPSVPGFYDMLPPF